AHRASQSFGDRMSFDTSTLYLVATLLAAMLGGMLVLFGRQENIPALKWWGGAYLRGARGHPLPAPPRVRFPLRRHRLERRVFFPGPKADLAGPRAWRAGLGGH